MKFLHFSSCGPLIILVCWLSINDAIPLYPAGQSTISSLEKNETLTTTQTTEKIPLFTETPKSINDNSSIGSAPHNSSVDTRVNLNETRDGLNESRTDNPNSDDNPVNKENDNIQREIPENTTESSGKCTSETHRRNRIYARSLPQKLPFLNVIKGFEMSEEAKAKRTTSLHIGENVALCWIETTTIKEDPNFDPPKRLVIREFSISFENSASIPDSYLECDSVEGEIGVGDEDTVKNSALHEVIDDNIKRSRAVNFTHENHVDGIIIRQNKKVKCTLGAVVTKDVFEWPDGTLNPKRRVEIKIGPSIRDLNKVFNDQSTDDSSGNIPEKSQENQSQDYSGDSTSDGDSSQSCRGPDCDNNNSSCEDEDCSRQNNPSDIRTSITDIPEIEEVLPGVSIGETTTPKIFFDTLSSAPSNKSNPVANSCSNNNTNCTSLEVTACSAEFCDEHPSFASVPEVPCDPRKNSSCACSGDNCKGNELSQNDKDESGILGSGHKEALTTTAEYDYLSNEKTNESFPEITESGSSSSQEYPSDESNEGTGMTDTTEWNSDEASIGPESTETLSINSDEASIGTENIIIGPILINSDEATEGIGDITMTSPNKNFNKSSSVEVNSTAESVYSETTDQEIKLLKPCDEPGAEGCVLDQHKGVQSSRNISASSFDQSDSNESVTQMSCNESDENCSGIESITKIRPSFKPFVTTTVSTTNGFATNLPASEIPNTTTDRFNETLIETQNIESEEGTADRIIDPSSKPIENVTSSSKVSPSDGNSSTEGAAGLKGFGDSNQTTVIPSSNLIAPTTIRPIPEGMTNLTSESCNFFGNCSSSNGNGTSNFNANQTSSENATEDGGYSSSCDDGSCESQSTSISGSGNCEDGSTDCSQATDVPEPCDDSSGSCSSETNRTETNRTETNSTETNRPDTNSTETNRTDTNSTETNRTETNRTETNRAETTTTTELLNETVSWTEETRRSIITTTPLSVTTAKVTHRLALRVKIQLEHIGENKKKEQLAQIERHLLFNEKPNEHGNSSLVHQLQALNKSMNLETLGAILNCTNLKNFSQDVVDLDSLVKDVIHQREVGKKLEGNMSLHAKPIDRPVEDSLSHSDGNEPNDSDDGQDKSLPIRRKREIPIALNSTRKAINTTDTTKEKAILASLPGVQEDLLNGMDHVLSRITKELNDSVPSGVNETAKSSTFDIQKIESNPFDSKVHNTSQNRTSRAIRSVAQVQDPSDGEEVERWSKERFVSAADGGQIRSLTEFRITRDHSEDSSRDPSGM